MNKLETILHPVRFKIIQVFLDGQNKTAKKLYKELKDIPQASLYRQLDSLVKAEVLIISEENPIRGTVEKKYSLNISAVNMTNNELKELTKEEHLQYFMIFTAQLTKNLETYLQKDDIDFQRDGVSYSQVALHLSDEEFLDFAKDIGKVYGKYIKNPPSLKRKRRMISNIIIPENERGTENE